jgi:hypothetical protein
VQRLFFERNDEFWSIELPTTLDGYFIHNNTDCRADKASFRHEGNCQHFGFTNPDASLGVEEVRRGEKTK